MRWMPVLCARWRYHGAHVTSDIPDGWVAARLANHNSSRERRRSRLCVVLALSREDRKHYEITQESWQNDHSRR